MHLKSEKIMLMWKIEVVLLKVSYTIYHTQEFSKFDKYLHY